MPIYKFLDNEVFFIWHNSKTWKSCQSLQLCRSPGSYIRNFIGINILHILLPITMIWWLCFHQYLIFDVDEVQRKIEKDSSSTNVILSFDISLFITIHVHKWGWDPWNIWWENRNVSSKSIYIFVYQCFSF